MLNSIEKKTEITEILQSASFPLQKWKSNFRAILKERKDNNTSTPCTIGKETKILGLRWSADHDQLHYKVIVTDQEQRTTKRAILQFVSQLFDPLGLIGPATIKAKFLLQHF